MPHSRWTRVIPVALLLALLTAAAEPLPAYVLQGEHILELMVKELGTADTLRVVQTVTNLQSQDPDHPVVTREIVTYGYPDRYRVDSENGTNQTLFVREGERTAVFENRVPAHTSRGRRWFYADVLLNGPRHRLADRLALAGVDVSVSSLGRHEGRVCYVVGAEYPDEAPAQLWVDQATLRPYRALLPGVSREVDESGQLDFRYLEWSQTEQAWYPRHIEVLRSGLPFLDVRAESVAIHPQPEPGFFSIAARMAEAQAFRATEEAVSEESPLLPDHREFFPGEGEAPEIMGTHPVLPGQTPPLSAP